MTARRDGMDHARTSWQVHGTADRDRRCLLAMPSCRRSLSSNLPPTGHDRVQLARYVRLRAIPPRPANENRRPSTPKLWHWALAIGTAPTIGLVLALTILT